MTTEPTSNDDTTFTSMGDTATSTIDTIWAELTGDIETIPASTDGPFDVDVDAGFDDPFALPTMDDGGLVGQPISLLMPWESEAGYLDPWALPDTGMDWTEFAPYDPMVCCSDWTVDGWTDTTAFAPVDAYGPGFDSTWLSEPGSYYDASAFSEVPGYWDTTGYYDTTADLYTEAFPDPGTTPGAPFDTGVMTDPTAAVYDTSAPLYDTTAYDTTAYDTTAYDTTGYDTSYDTSSFDATYDSSWDTTSWETPGAESTGTWDVEGAFNESQYWQTEYQDASDLEWDLWNASNDAWLNGDSELAYDLNQVSLEAGSYSDEAWNYSNDAWSDPGPYFDSSSTVDTTSSWDTSSSWDTTTDTGSEW